MDICGNYDNRNEGKRIVLYLEQVEKRIDTENQYVIHSNMNENETETNRDTLEQVVDELPIGTSPVLMDIL